LELRECFAVRVAQRCGDILAEAQHEALRHSRLKAEAVRHRSRHHDRARRVEGDVRRAVSHLPAAALDQQDLKELTVTMREDRPLMRGRTRADGLDLDEVGYLWVRQIAVRIKQRERSGGHAKA